MIWLALLLLIVLLMLLLARAASSRPTAKTAMSAYNLRPPEFRITLMLYEIFGAITQHVLGSPATAGCRQRRPSKQYEPRAS